jgi:hypothetical protein
MFNYYLNLFYLKYIPGNIFQNSLYVGITDVVAHSIAGFIQKKTSTKITLMSSYILSSIGSILYLIFYENETIVPIFVVMARFGN